MKNFVLNRPAFNWPMGPAFQIYPGSYLSDWSVAILKLIEVNTYIAVLHKIDPNPYLQKIHRPWQGGKGMWGIFQTPPDLVFIAKVLQDQFDIYSTQMYVPILRMESKWQHTRAYCFHSVINYDQLLKALSACSNFWIFPLLQSFWPQVGKGRGPKKNVPFSSLFLLRGPGPPPPP